MYMQLYIQGVFSNKNLQASGFLHVPYVFCIDMFYGAAFVCKPPMYPTLPCL